MDVSDRRMQVQLTPEAKIATDFFFIGAIFAFVDFVSALERRPHGRRSVVVFGDYCKVSTNRPLSISGAS